MDEHDHRHQPLTARHKLAWIVFAAIAGFYLWTEHRAHLLGALPFLLLAACPLMHFFMHGGHGHGGDPAGKGDGK